MPIVPVVVDNRPLLMEVDDRHVPVAPPQVAEGGFEGLEDTIRRVTTLGEFVQDACAQVYGAIAKAANTVHPDSVEVTFGVSLGGEAGVPFVAKGKAEASLEITLKWGTNGDHLGATTGERAAAAVSTDADV